MRKYELTERGKIIVAVLVVLILLILSAVLAVKAIANQAPDNGDDQSGSGTSTSSPPPESDSRTLSNSPPPNGGGFSPSDTPSPTESNNEEDSSVLFAGSNGEEQSSAPEIVGDNEEESSTPVPGNGGEEQSSVSAPGDGGEEESSTPVPGNGGEEESNPSPGQAALGSPESGLTGSPREGAITFTFSPQHQNTLHEDVLSVVGDFLRSPRNTTNSIIVVETPTLQDDVAQKLMAAVIGAFADYRVPEYRISHVSRSTGVTGDAFEVSMYFFATGGK